MSTDIAETLAVVLRSEAALDQWDTPPSLRFVLHIGDEYVLRDSQIPDFFWSLGSGDPKLALMIIMAMIKDIGVPEIEGLNETQFAGVALFSEGWGLHASGPDAIEDAQEYARHMSIEDHPNRYEVKMVTAVVDAKNVGMTLRRDTGEIEWEPVESGHQIDGMLFTILAMIARLIHTIL